MTLHKAAGEGASTLVCFAVREEARFFSLPPAAKGCVEVLFTGIGRTNAARALQAALARAPREWVLTCGFAGGLNPGLPLASVLFAVDTESTLATILTHAGALPGRFHCSPRIVVRASEKQALWQSTGADAVEMESEVIRQICRDQNVPSATVRAISDPADQDLPLDFNALLTQTSQIHYPKLLGSVVRRPSAIPALIRLQSHTRRAARQLGRVLRQVVTEECLSPLPRTAG